MPRFSIGTLNFLSQSKVLIVALTMKFLGVLCQDSISHKSSP